MLVYRVEVPPEDNKGATDANGAPIVVIDPIDALGYPGVGREEHSGEPVDEAEGERQ